MHTAPAGKHLPLTELIGRDREQADIRERLELSRLVTITGPGGIGKTHLALEIARATDSPLVDLAAITDAKLVLPEIATALGLDASPPGTLPIRIEGRHAVLVLDNAEQIKDVPTAFNRLLDATSGLRILATSRIPVGLPGEVEYPLGPLRVAGEDGLTADASPAVELFLARARALGIAVETDASAMDAIRAICRKLDGIPLAIELAVARLRVLSPQSLLERIDRDFSVLSDARRSERQRSLDIVLDWSIDSATPEQQALLAAASVCVGGFDVSTLASLEPDLDAIGGLDALIGRGLVDRLVAPGAPRFRLLETIRLGVSQRLTQAQRARLQERHALHFAELVRRAGTPLPGPEAADVPTLKRDRDNIRSAMEWALVSDEPMALELTSRLGAYWFETGTLDEGLSWLDKALQTTSDDETLRVHAEASRVELLRRQYAPGRLIAAQDLRQSALKLASGAVRCRALVLAAFTLAEADGSHAHDYLAEAMTEARATGSAAWLARIQMQIGFRNAQDGDYHASVENLTMAAETAARVGDRMGESEALHNLAWAQFELGHAGKALELAKRAGALVGDNPRNAAWFAFSIAQLAASVGDAERARISLSEAIAVVIELGGEELTAACLAASIPVAALDGHDELALRAAAAYRSGLTAMEITRWAGPKELDLEAAWSARARRAVGEVRARVLDEAGRRERPGELLQEILLAVQASATGDSGKTSRLRLRHGDLTGRETEILALLADGRSDGEIAEQLVISPKTASVHVSRIKEKLGVSTRLEASLRGRDLGLGTRRLG